MRAINKGQPPRNVARDDLPARTLKAAQIELRRVLKPLADPDAQRRAAREQFDLLDKEKVREVLKAEQHHLCVFCERPIPYTDHDEPDPAQPPIRIAHWTPLHHAAKRGPHLEEPLRLLWLQALL